MNQTITEGVLGNAIHLVTEAVPWSQSVALGVWIDRGSRDNAPGQSGLLHFLEHMTFRGTRNFSGLDIAKSLERYGGILNAFTGKEQICFFAHIALEHFPAAAEILRELAFYPEFPEEFLEREKRVILEEINALDDDPEDVVHEKLYYALWPKSALGLPIIGSQDQVSAFGRKDLLDEHRALLRSPVYITTVGNLTQEQVAEYFNGCPIPEAVPVPRREAVPEGRRYEFIQKDIAQSCLAMGTRTEPYAHGDHHALCLLNVIFGDGMSSRLFQNIREKHGLAYSIFSALDFYSDCGFFSIQVGAEPDNIRRVLTLICSEIRDLKRGDITARELDFAKSHIRGGLILAAENVNHRMGRLARGKIYRGRPETLSETLDAVDRVTLEDINGVVQKIFNDRQFCLVMAGPRDDAALFPELEF